MKIVTGYTGTPHITPNDDQARNQGIFGTGSYILNVGNKLAATLTNATTITLSDGDGVMQGVHFRIEPGMTETVSISPGTPGYNRIDLICARYTKEVSTGVEDVSIVVLEGTPTTGTPAVPTYQNGDILEGDTLAYMPLCEVELSGITPTVRRIAQTIISGVVTPYIYQEIHESKAYTPTGSSHAFGEDISIQLEKGTYIVLFSANAAFNDTVTNLYVVMSWGVTSPAVVSETGTSTVCAMHNFTISENKTLTITPTGTAASNNIVYIEKNIIIMKIGE